MILNKEIERHYHNWLKFSRKVARDNTKGDDLLHTTLAAILENPKAQAIAGRGELDQYVRFIIFRSYNSDTSTFHNLYRKVRTVELPAEITDASDSTWIGSRIDNETIDCVVRRLHPLDQRIFDLYCQPDFNYKDVADSTGIPYTYLRSRVHYIVKKIRKYVHRPTESSAGTNVDLPIVSALP